MTLIMNLMMKDTTYFFLPSIGAQYTKSFLNAFNPKNTAISKDKKTITYQGLERMNNTNANDLHKSIAADIMIMVNKRALRFPLLSGT
eukprot:CAMPEP_0197568348 /NCGR_PEP_ID=MMETSP1320-20131121/37169_1 /TAXON_ID=91990 /ORGANISM="Bolidomonas sp., Strain RCC2347" /LENGTH=87 /DNA_ID=CAMNT_0043130621 /DNA_START=676 /DNA_END=939 /DNA_ORIENTATION=-